MTVSSSSRRSTLTRESKVEVIGLSGPLCAGKSSLATRLVRRAGLVVRARDVLRARADKSLLSRRDLQEFGTALEASTHGRWLSQWLLQPDVLTATQVVVDAIRTRDQAESLRTERGATIIHLSATAAERRRRFVNRNSMDSADAGGGPAFDAAAAHDTEHVVNRLQLLADLAVDTTSLTEDGVYRVAIAFLEGLRAQAG